MLQAATGKDESQPGAGKWPEAAADSKIPGMGLARGSIVKRESPLETASFARPEEPEESVSGAIEAERHRASEIVHAAEMVKSAGTAEGIENFCRDNPTAKESAEMSLMMGCTLTLSAFAATWIVYGLQPGLIAFGIGVIGTIAARIIAPSWVKHRDSTDGKVKDKEFYYRQVMLHAIEGSEDLSERIKVMEDSLQLLEEEQQKALQHAQSLEDEYMTAHGRAPRGREDMHHEQTLESIKKALMG